MTYSRPTDDQQRSTPRGLRLDPVHEAAMEAAQELDRGYALAHPRAEFYVRPALAHEACPPGWPCLDPTGRRVVVTFLAPGLRIREVAA